MAKRTTSWAFGVVRTLRTAAAAELKPLYRRLSELGSNPRRSVAEVMSGWMGEGRAVVALELMGYVRQLRQYKNYCRALEVLEWMEMKGAHISKSFHAVRIDLIAKVKGVDIAEHYFNNLAKKNKQAYGAILNSYCLAKMTDKAITVYKEMNELGLAASTLVHNNIMNLYLKLGQPEKVLFQFEEMKSMNVTPDKYSYIMLMNSYASQKDICSVEKVLSEMEESGTALDWTVYSNIASFYKSAGLLKKVESTLKKLEEVMDKCEREPYHYLISFYGGIGKSAEVHRVWNLLKSAFSSTTNSSYLIMFQALRKLDDLESLKKYFEEWYSNYTTYDRRLIVVALGTYLDKNMVEEAKCIWEKAKSEGFDFRIPELFIDYYLKKHEIDLAMTWLEMMASFPKKEKWTPNRENIKSFLKHFKDMKDVSGAEAVCKHLKKFNCLNAEVYESLIRTYIAAGKFEPLLHQRIKEDGIELRPETKKLLERVCITT